MGDDGQPASELADRITRALEACEDRDGDAVETLLPLVYGELRRMAAGQLAGEKPGQTLQATALVHEAWLRLVGSEPRPWRSRSYFFAAAAEAMRRVLIENARRKCRHKRGGNWERVPIERVDLAQPPADEHLLLVDEALQELARVDPREAEVVKMHIFAGLEHAEIAAILGLSERTVKRSWAYARAWLYEWIRNAVGSGPGRK